MEELDDTIVRMRNARHLSGMQVVAKFKQHMNYATKQCIMGNWPALVATILTAAMEAGERPELIAAPLQE